MLLSPTLVFFRLPTRRTDVIDHSDPALKVTVSEDGAQGKQDFTLNFTTDGKEATNNAGGLELKSILAWESSTLVDNTKLKFQDQDVTSQGNLAAIGRRQDPDPERALHESHGRDGHENGLRKGHSVRKTTGRLRSRLGKTVLPSRDREGVGACGNQYGVGNVLEMWSCQVRVSSSTSAHSKPRPAAHRLSTPEARRRIRWGRVGL